MSARHKHRDLVEVLHRARQTQGLSNHKVDVLMGKNGTTSLFWEYRGKVPNVLGLIEWADALGYDVRLVKRKEER